MPDWLDTILEAADKFIITPREQMQYDAEMARIRADETLAAAQLASQQQQTQAITTGLMVIAVGGIGFLLYQAMQN